ncbi:hypothetical protein B6E66_13590 [Streptomyces maremycinicus]|nr:hypothetical protein B6E66_13590 [Streptomyces sp. B9173]
MDQPLLSMRSTLVILLALLAGTVTGALTALAGEGTPRSVLAGLAALGLTVPFFNRLIDTEGNAVQPQGSAGTAQGENNG